MAKFNTSFYSDASVTLPIERLQVIMNELYPTIASLFSNSYYLSGELRFLTSYLTDAGQIARWIVDNHYNLPNGSVLLGNDVEHFKSLSRNSTRHEETFMSICNGLCSTLKRKIAEGQIQNAKLPFEVDRKKVCGISNISFKPSDVTYRGACLYILSKIKDLVDDARTAMPDVAACEKYAHPDPSDYGCKTEVEIRKMGVNNYTLIWLDELMAHVFHKHEATFHYFEIFDDNAVAFRAMKGMVPLTPENFVACFKFNTEYFAQFVKLHLDRAEERIEVQERFVKDSADGMRDYLQDSDMSPEELDKYIQEKIIPRAKESSVRRTLWSQTHIGPNDNCIFDDRPLIGFTKNQLMEAIIERAEALGTYAPVFKGIEHLPTLGVMGGAFDKAKVSELTIPGIISRSKRTSKRFGPGHKCGGIKKYSLMCVYWAMCKCYQFEDWKQLVNADTIADVHAVLRAVGFNVPELNKFTSKDAFDVLCPGENYDLPTPVAVQPPKPDPQPHVAGLTTKMGGLSMQKAKGPMIMGNTGYAGGFPMGRIDSGTSSTFARPPPPRTGNLFPMPMGINPPKPAAPPAMGQGFPVNDFFSNHNNAFGYIPAPAGKTLLFDPNARKTRSP